jgi:hypothetical protein
VGPVYIEHAALVVDDQDEAIRFFVDAVPEGPAGADAHVRATAALLSWLQAEVAAPRSRPSTDEVEL